MTVSAEAWITQNQRGRLLVLEVALGAALSIEQLHVRGAHVNMMLDLRMTRLAFRVAHRLKRIRVAGRAVVSDEPVCVVQGTRRPQGIARDEGGAAQHLAHGGTEKRPYRHQ